METFDALRLCAAYAQETGMEAVLTRKGEKDAPFDLLFLPDFLAPGGDEAPMSLSVYFAASPYAFMDRLEYDLLHLMGYIEHLARPGTLRELRAFLGEVNFQMPIGAFDVDADGTVFLRYTLPVPRHCPGAAARLCPGVPAGHARRDPWTAHGQDRHGPGARAARRPPGPHRRRPGGAERRRSP